MKFGNSISYIPYEEIKTFKLLQKSSKKDPILSNIKVGQEAKISKGSFKGTIVQICSMPSKIISVDQYDLIHFIQPNKKVSNGLAVKEYDLRIAKVNLYLQNIIKIGFIKIFNFKSSRNKTSYKYLIAAKKKIITKQLLEKKQQEYDKLLSYINE